MFPELLERCEQPKGFNRSVARPLRDHICLDRARGSRMRVGIACLPACLLVPRHHTLQYRQRRYSNILRHVHLESTLVELRCNGGDVPPSGESLKPRRGPAGHRSERTSSAANAPGSNSLAPIRIPAPRHEKRAGGHALSKQGKVVQPPARRRHASRIDCTKRTTTRIHACALRLEAAHMGPG